MNPIISTIYFLPCVTAIIWTVLYAWKLRTTRQKIFFASIAWSIIYFGSAAIYIYPNIDYHLMAKIDMVNVPVCLMMISSTVIYMDMHYREETRIKPWYMLMFIPSIILGTGSSITYYVLGMDNAAELLQYYDVNGRMPQSDAITMRLYNIASLFTETLINVIGGIMAIYLLYLCVMTMRKEGYKFGNIYRFFFSEGESTPGRILSILYIVFIALIAPVVILGRVYMMEHSTYAIITMTLVAVTIHTISYVEFYSNVCEKVTFHNLVNIDLATKSAQEEGQQKAEQESIEVKPQDSAFMTLTYEKFKRLMEEDRLYRDENLTLITLSEFMGIGRTTISQMVKIHYGMPFRDVLNKYRINAAMQYMQSNPKATQDTVAMECGYKNGNYLNSKFKEIVGETPLMWLAKQAENNNKS